MNKKSDWFSLLCKLFFWVTLCLVTALSVLAMPGQQIFQWQDKLIHLVGYMLLFWVFLLAYGKQCNLVSLGILLALFGGLIEVAQSFTAYRQAEWLDLLANIVGILVAALLYKLFKFDKNANF
jgi:VanZ family protein